jgi:hypothetical protein
VGEAEKTEVKAGVFRRHVLYIPGYDPFPPRRYREFYRKEGAAQAAMSGYSLTMHPRHGAGYGWRVTTSMEAPAEIEMEILVWSDLVKHSMTPGIVGTYRLMLRTAWLYLSSGALVRLVGLRKGPMIAALYPAVALILQAMLALTLGGLVVRFLPGPGVLRWSLAAVVTWAVLEGFRRIDRRLLVYYLMQDYAFATMAKGAWPPVLAARMGEFGARLRQVMVSGVDEVLVVGHSSGAQIGVTVLADLIREGLPEGGPALGFLSLGQAIPMVSFLPEARRLRGDLAYLSTRAELTWVDVSAPGDGASFALCDPVAVSGVAPKGQRWPLILSAAFSQTLSPERWKALKRRFFWLHFQYLYAFDNLKGEPGEYDYFRITAGPLTLAERFAGRSPSASRISRACSPYRDIA